MNISFLRFTATILTIVLLTACSSQSIEHTKYLLRNDTAPQFSGEVSTVGMSAIRIAPYIDKMGLVLETAAGQIHEARNHQWAEPLRESLLGYMANEISRSAEQPIEMFEYKNTRWQKRIELHLDQLHGTADGNALLVAYWTVIDTEKRAAIFTGTFSQKEPLNRDGYGPLVDAEKTLLNALAQEIAASL